MTFTNLIYSVCKKLLLHIRVIVSVWVTEVFSQPEYVSVSVDELWILKVQDVRVNHLSNSEQLGAACC